MKAMSGLSGQMRLNNRASSSLITNNRMAVRPSRRVSTISAALDFSSAPLEVLVGGGAFVLTTAGYLVYEAVKASQANQQAAPKAAQSKPKELPRENAVVVFGASGRTGRQVVAEASDSMMILLKAGRTVVAAVRDESRAKEAIASLGIKAGRQSNGSGILFIQSGVDVTDASTLTSDLFKGAEQVVCTLGPIFGRTADGQMGYLDNMTSERVDNMGVSNVAAAASKYLKPARRTVSDVLPMKSTEDLAKWQRLDDVIMGGSSSSVLEAAADGTRARWAGDLIIEGGGFCGARTLPMELDLSRFDGVSLRVKTNNSQTLKLNIKTDTFSEPEDTYQATFETLPDGDWTTVYIPWHEFVPVKRARSLPGGPPLDPSKIRQFGLVYSKFQYNGYPNDSYTPGPFEFQFEGGIKAFNAPRPQILLVSSAGVERNAKIGDDVEARKKDIPIVQLNPGGTLNHKYAGEAAVRATGLPYAVIRPTGMSDDAATAGPALLEASQGDRISGKVARSEVAALVAAATGLPAAANKTLEIRRSEAADAQGKEMTNMDALRLFLGAVLDRQRQQIGLEPFPAPAPPPPPPTEERKSEILADPRVQAARERNAGGRVRTEEESAGAKTVTAVDDGRAAAVPVVADQTKNSQDNAPMSSSDDSSSAEPVPDNVADAREWIRRWRAKNLERQLPQGMAAAAKK